MATKQSYEDYQRYVGLAREAGPQASAPAATSLTDGRLGARLLRPADRPDRAAAAITSWCARSCSSRSSRWRRSTASTRRWTRANDTHFGLTAGLFSREQDEIDAFLDRIEAGVVYVNRAAGATTGAWPGVQPFGGWKGSGSTGKNIGGHYTLPCYLREQSRTVCA